MFPGFRGGGRGGFPPPFQGGRFPMMNPNMNNMNGMGFQAFGQFNNRPGMQNFMPNNMQNNFMPNMGRGGRGGMGRGGRGGMMGPGRMGPGPSPTTPNPGTSTVDKTPPVVDKTPPVVDNSSPAVDKSKPIVEKTSEVKTSTASTPTTVTSVVKTETVIKPTPSASSTATTTTTTSAPKTSEAETVVTIKRAPVLPGENEPEYDDNLCLLDWYNSDLNLNINPTDFCSAEAISKNGFGYMWGGARATYGATRGRVCFEVRIDGNMPVNHLEEEETPNVLRVGWSVGGSNLQLGEVKHSFGYGGTGKAAESCVFKNYGVKFGVGDVIGAFLDVSSDYCFIKFTVNGKDQGIAYRFQKPDLKGQALFPHVLTKNQNFTVNFGQLPAPLFSLLPGFTPIGQLDVADGLVRGPLPPPSRAGCEVLMMLGLPGAGKTFWAEKYAKEHPEKNYNILGTNNLIEKMKVNGLSRKRNYHGRWEVLIKKCTECFNTILDLAAKRRRNYILDQTNVFPTARGRKLKDFKGFTAKAVVVVPPDDEFRRRVAEREAVEGKEIPDNAVLNMKSNFVLPELEETFFSEVWYTELPPEEAHKVINMYNEEARSSGLTIMQGVRSFKHRNENKRREQKIPLPGKHVPGDKKPETKKISEDKVQASTSSVTNPEKTEIKPEPVSASPRIGELKKESRDLTKKSSKSRSRSRDRDRKGRDSRDRRRSRSRERRRSTSRGRSNRDGNNRSWSSDHKDGRDKGRKRSRSRSRDRNNQRFKKEPVISPWNKAPSDSSGSFRGRDGPGTSRGTGFQRGNTTPRFQDGAGTSLRGSDVSGPTPDLNERREDQHSDDFMRGGRGRGFNRGRGGFQGPPSRGRGFHSNRPEGQFKSEPREPISDPALPEKRWGNQDQEWRSNRGGLTESTRGAPRAALLGNFPNSRFNPPEEKKPIDNSWNQSGRSSSHSNYNDNSEYDNDNFKRNDYGMNMRRGGNDPAPGRSNIRGNYHRGGFNDYPMEESAPVDEFREGSENSSVQVPDIDEEFASRMERKLAAYQDDEDQSGFNEQYGNIPGKQGFNQTQDWRNDEYNAGEKDRFGPNNCPNNRFGPNNSAPNNRFRSGANSRFGPPNAGPNEKFDPTHGKSGGFSGPLDRFGPNSGSHDNLGPSNRFGMDSGSQDRLGPNSGPLERFGPSNNFGQNSGPHGKFGPNSGPSERFGPNAGPIDRFGPNTGTSDRFGPNTGPSDRFGPNPGPSDRFGRNTDPHESFRPNDNSGPHNRLPGPVSGFEKSRGPTDQFAHGNSSSHTEFNRYGSSDYTDQFTGTDTAVEFGTKSNFPLGSDPQSKFGFNMERQEKIGSDVGPENNVWPKNEPYNKFGANFTDDKFGPRDKFAPNPNMHPDRFGAGLKEAPVGKPSSTFPPETSLDFPKFTEPPPSFPSSTGFNQGSRFRSKDETTLGGPNSMPGYPGGNAKKPPGFQEQKPPIIPSWNEQGPKLDTVRGGGEPGRFPITSDGAGVGMGYSVQYHGEYGMNVGAENRFQGEEVGGMLNAHSHGSGYPQTQENFPKEKSRNRSRMNMDINSIPGMNPPAPDASLGSVNPNPMNQPPPGSMNPGPGSGTPGGPGGSGPDYAALLQYLQYYQKQMGSEESEGKS